MDKRLYPLSDLAAYAGTTPGYLRYLIFKKRLKGQKEGKIWFSKKEWVDEYKLGPDGDRNKLLPLSELAGYAGTTPDYLRYLIFKKKA